MHMHMWEWERVEKAGREKKSGVWVCTWKCTHADICASFQTRYKHSINCRNSYFTKNGDKIVVPRTKMRISALNIAVIASHSKSSKTESEGKKTTTCKIQSIYRK